MNESILAHVRDIVGQQCCLRRVGKDRSLNLGFGEVVRHKTVVAEANHGTWEIGTYCCSWRVVCEGNIVSASRDIVDDIEDLRRKTEGVNWGRFSDVRHLSDYDLRVEFDNGVSVDFLATNSDDDELVHILTPKRSVIEFSIARGWVLGPSDRPWGVNSRD